MSVTLLTNHSDEHPMEQLRGQSTLLPPHAQGSNFLEFFAGIGLMRMGLERAGWRALYANDISPEKRVMYQANFPDTDECFECSDIHCVLADSIPAATLATASFPCTDLSLAGARQGLAGQHSSAYWGFIRLLSDMGERRPPMVLIENVTGFLTSKQGDDFAGALRALNQLGYVVDAVVIDAARFVPQSRVRVFVVGWRPDGAVGETPGFYESDARPPILADFVFAHPEIQWCLRPLPPLPRRGARLPEIVEDLPPEADEWWNRSRAEYLVSQMSGTHRERLAAMIRQDQWSYGTVFRRVRQGTTCAEMRTDGLAGCLRTPKGGSARQILVKAGFGEVHVRLLTPRECARLMGADDFVINVPLNQALFGFGDAVCVPVVSWLATNYLNPLLAEISQGREARSSYLEREKDASYGLTS